MAINIKFDLANNPEPPTIILARRNGDKLGQLDAKEIELNDKFNDASEMSFTLYKYTDGELTNLWDKVVDFRLIYCKEWDMWFEIKVELDEETETIKTVFCTQLGQAELSQLMLYDIHINEEGDSNWDTDNKEYKSTILYNPDDTSASLLHRLLKDKAPHYSIIHVDSTIANIQRTFSFDGTSIYDAFQEIAEEIGCLFVFHSNSDKNGKIQRTISVYDLQQNCLNLDCVYRGEFTDVCPECGSTNVKYGYGEDTTIFVTSDELASEGIQLTTDTDSVKNCFKLEAGDDLMTATIRNCNPNGTDYIWYFSEDMKSDMSEELVDKIESYDEIYKEYYNNYISDIDVDSYNTLVKKYQSYNEDLQEIITPIKGYSALMNAYYNTIDLALYLESGLMPSVEIAETNAEEQVTLLTSTSLSPVAVANTNIDSVSLATANSAVLSMAKVIVKSTFKVEIGTSTLSDDKTWTGNFVITNYSDEEDTCTTDNITVGINNDMETFLQQKIDKALNKEDADDLSISGLFGKDYDEFCVELKKYALNPLTSFYDACEACLSILQEQGVANEETWADITEGADSNLYEKLYLPYYDKLSAIADEMTIREDEIALIEGIYDETDEDNSILITKGIQTYINECKNEIQEALNFEDYIGSDLWLEFCSYRREDKYSNDNYISDGLSNTDLFAKAREFINVAESEIFKSAELQHSISSTLNNLLAIEKFKPLVKYFSVGNWIRVRIDEKIYKLRLLEYSIDYGSFNTIPVEFSDVTKIKTGITDVQEILSQASSMATSYSSVQRQASQGENVKDTVDKWFENGLNSAFVQIQNNDTEDIILTKNGLLCRSYNEITDTYNPEQLKITHNIMAYTDDNWKTVSTALGKHDYIEYSEDESKFIEKTGYGLTADFVTAGIVNGSQIIGGDIYSDNYSNVDETGSYLNLRDGTFSFAGGKLTYDGDHLSVDGEITVATSGTIGCWNINEFSIYKGSDLFGNVNGMYFGTEGLSLGSTFKVTSNGILTATDGIFTGTINANYGTIGGFNIESSYLAKNTKILAGNSNSVYLGIDGISCGTDFSVTKAGALTSKTGYIAGFNFNEYGFTKSFDDGQLIFLGTTSISSAGYTQALRIISLDDSTYEEPIYYSINLGSTADSWGNGISIMSEDYGSGIYIGYSSISRIGITSSSMQPTSEILFQNTGVEIEGYLGCSGRMYLQNSTGIRGLKSGYNVISYSDSNCIGCINSDDRTVLGHHSNSAATEIRSPEGSAVFLKCNGVTSDESRYTVKLSYGTVDGSGRGYFMPTYNTDGGTSYTNLGSTNARWKNVYATNGSIETSDRNLKRDIELLSEKYINMFDLLKPVSYKMLEGDRTHVGFISQEVEDAMKQVGLTAEDFGGFCKDIKTKYDSETEQNIPVLDENGNCEYSYSLRYGEFIALNTAKIKQLEQLVLQLQDEINKLKS